MDSPTPTIYENEHLPFHIQTVKSVTALVGGMSCTDLLRPKWFSDVLHYCLPIGQTHFGREGTHGIGQSLVSYFSFIF